VPLLVGELALLDHAQVLAHEEEELVACYQTEEEEGAFLVRY